MSTTRTPIGSTRPGSRQRSTRSRGASWSAAAPSETLEGDWHPRRIVVLQFPSADHARGWYESPDYVKLMEIRRRASTGSLILAEGAEF